MGSGERFLVDAALISASGCWGLARSFGSCLTCLRIQSALSFDVVRIFEPSREA